MERRNNSADCKEGGKNRSGMYRDNVDTDVIQNVCVGVDKQAEEKVERKICTTELGKGLGTMDNIQCDQLFIVYY